MSTAANPVFTVEDDEQKPKFEIADATPEKEGFAKSFGATLPGYNENDPLGAAKDLYSGGKHMLSHPLDSASLLYHGITDPMSETASAGAERFGKPGIGNKIAGGAEYLEGGVPILGPMLAKAGHQFESGDVGGGLGTTAGAALPTLAGSPEVRATVRSAARSIVEPVNTFRRGIAEKAVGPLVYENVGETAADRRMGVKPESGIVNEGHVGTKAGILEDAAKRTADLKQAANNILQNHPNAGEWIDANPLIDQAIDNAIKQTEKVAGSTERLENLRTALKTKYGRVEGHPLEMNNLKTEIQEAASGLGAYKNTQPVEASAAAAMKDAARLIKEKVNSLIPEAADLNERMSNSMDAQAGLQKKIDAERGRSLFGGFHEGMTGTLLNRTLGSAPVRTGLARGLMAGLTEDVPEPIRVTPFAPVSSHTSPLGPPAAQALTYPPVQEKVGNLPPLGFPAQPNLWAGMGERAPQPQFETPTRISTEPGLTGHPLEMPGYEAQQGILGRYVGLGEPPRGAAEATSAAEGLRQNKASLQRMENERVAKEQQAETSGITVEEMNRRKGFREIPGREERHRIDLLHGRSGGGITAESTPTPAEAAIPQTGGITAQPEQAAASVPERRSIASQGQPPSGLAERRVTSQPPDILRFNANRELARPDLTPQERTYYEGLLADIKADPSIVGGGEGLAEQIRRETAAKPMSREKALANEEKRKAKSRP